MVEDLSMQRERRRSGCTLQRFDGRRVARINFDGPIRGFLENQVNSEEAPQLATFRESKSQSFQLLPGRNIESNWSDAAAIMEPSRVQPFLANQLSRQTKKTRMLASADIAGGIRITRQIALQISMMMRDYASIPNADSLSARASNRRATSSCSCHAT